MYSSNCIRSLLSIIFVQFCHRGFRKSSMQVLVAHVFDMSFKREPHSHRIGTSLATFLHVLRDQIIQCDSCRDTCRSTAECRRILFQQDGLFVVAFEVPCGAITVCRSSADLAAPFDLEHLKERCVWRVTSKLRLVRSFLEPSWSCFKT